MVEVKYFGIGVVLFILAGCGGGGDSYGGGTTPPNTANANIAGTWRGTSTSTSAARSNTITLVLTQTESSVSGSFACTPTQSCFHTTATVAGIVSGQSFTGTVLYPDNHSCSAFNGTLSGTTLSGNYTCEDTVTDTGTWSATKQ